MHSFMMVGGMVVVAAVGGRGAALPVPAPTITSPPSFGILRRQIPDPDALSLAQVLLTAVPISIRQVAATNLPAASSILWSEFLDDRKPEWFSALPWDIQSYLIEHFGPGTAAPPQGPSTIAFADPSATATEVPESSGAVSISREPAETSQPSVTSPAESTQAESTQVSETATLQSSQESDSSRSPSSTIPASSFATSPTGTLISPTASSSTSAVPAPLASTNTPGLSRGQKIGIGVGVPFALIGAAALVLGLCVFLRRRRNQKVDGSIPPSSPGFIPRFAFQEKSTDSLGERRPLNRDSGNSFQDLNNMTWDDDIIEPANNQNQNVGTQQTIMAPALFHTHSSNRARGKRTSYTSLHSVAEVSEPDDIESPVLPRHSPHSPWTSPRQSPQRNIPSHPSLVIPPAPAAAKVKRKPVPSSPSEQSPAVQVASHTLLRQTMGGSSSSSGFGSQSTGESSTPSRFSSHAMAKSNTPPRYGNHVSVTSLTSPYVSPIEEDHSDNPFRSNSPYVEDYGPEYHGQGYADIEDALYSGHALYGGPNLSRYPEPKNPKTEWPLRNGTRHKRTQSPMWDRVYEG